MDQTNLYKALVKTVKLRSKNVQNGTAPAAASTKIAAKPNEDKISLHARRVVSDISRLKHFLLKHRREYINASSLIHDAFDMTDYQRDQIDVEAQQIVQSCSHLVKNLKLSVQLLSEKHNRSQQQQHQTIICEVVEAYLQAVCKNYTQHKAIRVKHAVDMKKLSRLEIMIGNSTHFKNPLNSPFKNGLILKSKTTHSPSLQKRQRSITDENVIRNENDNEPKEDNAFENAAEKFSPRISTKSPLSDQILPDFDSKSGLRRRQIANAASVDDALHNVNDEVVKRTDRNAQRLTAGIIHTAGAALDDDDDRFLGSSNKYTPHSPEERKQLEKENELLYREMNSMVDEIQEIEGKMVEIANLQQVFTEKVLQQDHDIQRIHDNAVFSTENVQAGNQQIREAMKQKAMFRLWILFFLIVMTFTLLFLDWYNA